MPISKIFLLKGRSSEFKRKVLDIVHQSLVTSIHKPQDDRRQMIFEFDSEHFEFGGRSEQFLFIEINLLKGRSAEAKRNLFKLMVDQLHFELSIPKNDITIMLNEQELGNWGIHGGNPASDFEWKFV